MQRQANNYSLITILIAIAFILLLNVILFSTHALVNFSRMLGGFMRKLTVRVVCLIIGCDPEYKIVTTPRTICGHTSFFPNHVICKCRRCNKTF